MRSVVGPLPPPSPRQPVRYRLRRRPRLRTRERRGVQVSARQFALLSFCVWGVLLAALDFTMGKWRHPGTVLAEPIGTPEPPPAILPERAEPARPLPRARGGRTLLPVATGPLAAPAVALGNMIVPVAGIATDDLRDSFDEPRSGGRRHGAIDILAPRNTPILAAADGTIVKIFESKDGGHTIYQIEPSGHYELYYAHLESYAPGAHEGEPVRQGQVIGYVGTSGNAPKDVPHLHFALYRLGPDRAWWKGDAIDPFPLLTHREANPPLLAR